MTSILKELWYGNIDPINAGAATTQESKALVKSLSEYYDLLKETLTEEQKELFEKYNDCYAKLSGISECDNFIYGYTLGMRITYEAVNLDL